MPITTPDTSSPTYTRYQAVIDRIGIYRQKLDNLFTFFNNQHPVIYVAAANKKQYWFMKVETVSKNLENGGTYSLSISGRGVRAVFSQPVDPVYFTDSQYTYMVGENRPHNPNAFTHTSPTDTLTRCEIYGRINSNITPDKISFSDIMRNSTVVDLDDYLIGLLPYSHFVGNFAAAALGLLDFDPYDISANNISYNNPYS